MYFKKRTIEKKAVYVKIVLDQVIHAPTTHSSALGETRSIIIENF